MKTQLPGIERPYLNIYAYQTGIFGEDGHLEWKLRLLDSRGSFGNIVVFQGPKRECQEKYAELRAFVMRFNSGNPSAPYFPQELPAV